MYLFALLLKGHLQQEIPQRQESLQLLDTQLLQQYLLDGEAEPEGQCLTITLLPNRQQQAMLRITWYGQITMKTVIAHMMHRMSRTPLSLGHHHFTLETIEIDHPTWTGISIWTDLSRKKSGYHIRFRFVTPIVTKISSCAGKQELSLTQILNECALCDTHGFLVTAKNAHDENEVTRARLNKETVINFGYALALPNFSKETEQLHTRSGGSKEEGQMLMKIAARSGVYALTIRYTCAAIDADTRQWQLLVTDSSSRLKRHRALLSALRDLLVSPNGATMGTMLPHFTGLRGAIVERTSIGRAPCLSGLDEAFLSKLSMMEDETCHVLPFDHVGTFYQLMNQLIDTTSPALHPSWKNVDETVKM